MNAPLVYNQNEEIIAQQIDDTNMKIIGSNCSKINLKELIASGSTESKDSFESFQTELKEMKPNLFGKFPCTKCDYEIKSKGSLRRHFLSKHIGMIFKCGKCSKELTSQSGLKSHMESVHEQYSGSWVYSNDTPAVL